MNSIILTGATRGLGQELHNILVKNSLPSEKCFFVSRKPVSEPNEGCKYIQADFSKQGELDFRLDIKPETKVVVFISNAGTIEPIGKAEDVLAPDLERALRINCTGPLTLAQQLVTKTRDVGARLFVLNVSSGAARRPIKGWMAYCVSKAAVVMALDVLAVENDHVTIQHFDPGVMDTDMQSHIRCQSADVMPDVGLFQEFKNEHVLKSPREVAENIIAIVRDVLR
jgi:benzil reductase ((S)-benzoin forming)